MFHLKDREMMWHGIDKHRLITYADDDECHRKVGPVRTGSDGVLRDSLLGERCSRLLPLAPLDLSVVFALLGALYGLHHRPSWVALPGLVKGMTLEKQWRN